MDVAGYSKSMQFTIGMAATFAGRDRQAIVRRGQPLGWPAPSLNTVTSQNRTLWILGIVGANELDIMWGAFFATGNAFYAQQIMAFLDHTVARSENSIADIIAASRQQVPPAYAAEVREKSLPPARLMSLLTVGTALWGMLSNARQHPVIVELVANEKSKSPPTGVGRLLQAAVPQQKPDHARIVIEQGNDIRIILSATSNRRLVDSIKTTDQLMNAMLNFTNRFSVGSDVIIVSSVILEKMEAVTFSLEMMLPTGEVLNLVRDKVVKTDEGAVFIKSIPLDSRLLMKPGEYLILGTYVGARGSLSVEFHFYNGSST